MCGGLNEVMAEHFSPTGDGGQRMDVDQHPQLAHGSVEFIAPTEYMVSLAPWMLPHLQGASAC